MSRGGLRGLVVAVTLVVVATVVAGVFVVGAPSEARKKKLDDMRVEDLVHIETAISRYALQHAAVPRDLLALDEVPGLSNRADPETGAGYEYEAIDEHAYRLCAVFSAPSDDNASTRRYRAETWRERREPAAAK